MKSISTALDKAYSEGALFATAELRSHATARGWDSTVVNSLRVVHKDGKFSVRFPESVADQAWVHEYGDPDNTPTGVIRKYDNYSPKLTEFIAQRFGAHFKGIE